MGVPAYQNSTTARRGDNENSFPSLSLALYD